MAIASPCHKVLLSKLSPARSYGWLLTLWRMPGPGSRFEVIRTVQASLCKAHHQHTKTARLGPAGHLPLSTECARASNLCSTPIAWTLDPGHLESIYYSSGNFRWRNSLLFPATGCCLWQLITVCPALLKNWISDTKTWLFSPRRNSFLFLTTYPR